MAPHVRPSSVAGSSRAALLEVPALSRRVPVGGWQSHKSERPVTGFCVAAATQYLAQIGASIKTGGIHDYVLDAANLLQTRSTSAWPTPSTDRNLPTPGRGSTVPHTLAVQLVIGALRQFGGTDAKTVWWTR